MYKKLLASLVFIVFNLMFFVQPNNILADDDPTDLGELPTESEDIEETTSQSSYDGGSEFDTSQYNGYNTSGFDDDEFSDKYFYTSLKEVTKVNGPFPAGQTGTDPVQVYKEIREELAMTGYEAYCMAENVKIDPKYNTTHLIDEFLRYYPSGVSSLTPNGVNIPTVSTEALGTDNAEYPIWRDVDDKQFLMTSLEEYFGFKDVYEEDPALSEIKTAPINSLLSQEQACVQGWESLAAQRRACNKLEDKTTCALTKRKIPGDSGLETHDLMGMAADFYKKYGTQDNWAMIAKKDIDPPSVEGCKILFADPKSAEKELDSIEKLLKDTIINVATYHDRSYRLGFIIAAIETRQPSIPDPNVTKADIIFNFFTPKTQVLKIDEVLVAAFKLPDIGTNKGPKSNWGHEEWNDPLDLTRLVLTTKENQEIHEGERQSKRESVLSAAEDAANQVENSKIYCLEKGKANVGDNGPNLLPGSGTNTCLVPLPRALVDIVNGNVKDDSCEKSAETVDFISDLAGLRTLTNPYNNNEGAYGKEFNSEFGGQVLLNLFFGSVYNADGNSPGYASVDFDSIWSVNDDTWSPKTKNSVVHFYLVYPMGFELEAVEEAIKGTFFSTEQIATMDEDPDIVNVFEMTGQNQSLAGGDVGWKYKDIDKTANKECDYYIDPETGEPDYSSPKDCIERPTIKIKQGGGNIDILGGKLSWWLRKVQVSLSSSVSSAHSYYQSCETMEEFLLGKCDPDGGGYGEPEDLACEELQSLDVAVPTMNEIMKMTCNIANNDTNDAQLLWGLLQIEWKNLHAAINAGKTTIKCGEILYNSCGASQIVGVLIPQCIDVEACSQATSIANDTTDPWIQEARENPDIACNVEASMEFILRKRKSEVTWLRSIYNAANGVDPDTKQLYYMMAGRNYGVPQNYLTQPECGDYEEVDGCNGSNYCVCAMDEFIMDCGNIVN